MRLSKWMAGVALAAMATAAVAQTAGSAGPLDPKQSAENIRAHMGFLADDLLQGRDTGTDSYKIAAHYVASQYRQLGLKPAGDNGSYFQKVRFSAYRPVDQGTYALRGRNGQSTPLVGGQDILISKNPGPTERKVSAPLVFVGYGLDAPEIGHADYKGLDVKGKIVVVLQGAPTGVQSEQRAYYANLRNKRAVAAKYGAVGLVSVYKPSDEKRRPFATYAKSWHDWSMSWVGKDDKAFDPAPSVPSLGLVSVAAPRACSARRPPTRRSWPRPRRRRA